MKTIDEYNNNQSIIDNGIATFKTSLSNSNSELTLKLNNYINS